MVAKGKAVCAACWVDSGDIEGRNTFKLDAPKSKIAPHAQKPQICSQLSNHCSDISICHFSSPQSNFCHLVILRLIKDEQIFMPLPTSFHLAVTF